MGWNWLCVGWDWLCEGWARDSLCVYEMGLVVCRFERETVGMVRNFSGLGKYT